MNGIYIGKNKEEKGVMKECPKERKKSYERVIKRKERKPHGISMKY